MVVKRIIRLKFIKQRIRFDETEISFTINRIKSRFPSVVYFIHHFFNQRNEEIGHYTSPEWIIGTEFQTQTTTYDVDADILEQSAYTQIELVCHNITSENPLYFTECMLKVGEFTEYHKPSELLDSQQVVMNKNIYANIYNKDDNYLQVIRPNKAKFHTDKLDKCNATILAPHLEDESDLDDPVNLMLEYINMTEQTITIQK